ncbi:MAG: 16S rRNA (uracil(1498)-N(3))-methyltransferase [Magnetovibrio sp.]|nr:16S rRNA (uracil(1498)-N(3))-methyltransferase [Magnetovibrio sp.]
MTGMARALPRLFVETPLAAGGGAELAPAQAHYLKNVMRLAPGREVLLFNGRDGEWRGEIVQLDRKTARIEVRERTRAQPAAEGPWLAFAPVKKAGTQFIVEKATELGAQRLSPIFTEFTDTTRVNIDRLRDNAVEAAEQCGRLNVPVIDPARPLSEFLKTWETARPLVHADESGAGEPILEVLERLAKAHGTSQYAPAFVIGPQGGFSESELVTLDGLAFVNGVDLGPRILRTETAVAAVLTCWQAAFGDWRD